MSQDMLPGVVFYHTGSEMLGTVKSKKVVRVTLRAEIENEEVWQAAFDKLKEGLKVYTADDFKTELLNALREEHANVEAENKRMKIELDRLRDENQQMTAALSVIHSGIEG